MRLILSLLSILALLSSPLLSQDRRYRDGQEEYFVLNQLPDMRAEAMGKAQVALGGDMIQNFTNPASLGWIKHRSAAISSSGPFYILRESDFGYLGYAQRLDRSPWVAGVSVRSFWIGPSTFNATIQGQRYQLDLARTTNATLTIAREILPGLQVGLNTNLYRLRLFRDARAGHMPHFDLGLLYRKNLSKARFLSAGASFNNFTFSRITYKAPNGDQDRFNMPAILRAGLSYGGHTTLPIPGGDVGRLDYLITVEYQDYLNSEFFTAFRAGGEVTVWKLLILRVGAFRMRMNDGGLAENFSRIRDITYGFGLVLDFDRIGIEIPLEARLDYTSLQQARTSSLLSSRIPNMRGLSL
ncbi:MAG: hypothetical protein AAF804_04920, partial [Bacteroidota bacterium]